MCIFLSEALSLQEPSARVPNSGLRRSSAGDEHLPPICHYYAYHPNGNLRTEQEDWGCSGVPGSCTSYTYDENSGRLTMQQDSNCSCRHVRTTCYLSTYDADGNQVTRNEDDDCDGATPMACQTTPRRWRAAITVNSRQPLVVDGWTPRAQHHRQRRILACAPPRGWS